LQIVEREGAQAYEGVGAGLAQIGKRALDGFPGGVLGEISTQNHFKGSLRRPPVLGAIGCGKLIVHLAQALGGGELARWVHGWESGD